ncbi:MAG TPA: hypothetical protein VKU60_07995 [Chloroflexota bacterium]|nr:hypothetical protein [Chloroflexota bacterium]
MASILSQFIVGVNISWTYQAAVTGFGSANYQNPAPNQYSQTLTNGTGIAGTANQLYVAQASITASGNTSLDFASGLNDPFGAALAMARVKYIFINNNNATAASSITVGNATHPLPLFSAGSTTVTINNNGFFAMGDPGATGIAVGSGATDTLKIVNADSGNVATVNTIAVGSTA